MSYCTTRTSQATARRSWMTRVAAIAGACVVSLQPAPRADAAAPPSVPAGLEVPAGNRLLRVGHAIGTQNYVCLPSTMKPPVDWTLFGPQATLFNNHDRQIMTHFQSPNADENDELRPVWQDSSDTSAVWAKRRELSSDPDFVEAGAIPWLLLEVVGRDTGPKGRHGLTRATFVHRVNTSGGQAPATGCTDVMHIGARAYVPYTADYFFYRSVGPLE